MVQELRRNSCAGEAVLDDTAATAVLKSKLIHACSCVPVSLSFISNMTDPCSGKPVAM